ADDKILVITENGYGKRTKESEYRVQSRGGMGIKTCHVTEKNGPLVAVRAVNGTEDIMLITQHGVLIRMDVEDISTTGRNTQGVRLIRLGDDEVVATVTKVKKDLDDAEAAEVDEETEPVSEDNVEALIEESVEADVYTEDKLVEDETEESTEDELEE
ncbi:DNA gyrase C-terminal beta-propeller domain-containing protein, partial [Streptococcus pneumoniae]|nr:DNA gyrase C-terminal beta-propeller domain-containing protein [Streptococcus pneumoniae]